MHILYVLILSDLGSTERWRIPPKSYSAMGRDTDRSPSEGLHCYGLISRLKEQILILSIFRKVHVGKYKKRVGCQAWQGVTYIKQYIYPRSLLYYMIPVRYHHTL